MRRRGLLRVGVVALVATALMGIQAAVACDSEGGAPAPAVTPQPTQAPTPYPPTRTPVVVPTPHEVTPVPAAGGGRPDCPEGWNVYWDPDDHFSFCYPPGLNIITGAAVRPELGGDSVNMWTADAGAHFPSVERADVSDNGFFIAMGWDAHPKFNPAVVKLEKVCPLSALLIHQETSAPVELQIAGRTAVGCIATGFDDPSRPPMKVISLAIPAGPTGAPEEGYVTSWCGTSGRTSRRPRPPAAPCWTPWSSPTSEVSIGFQDEPAVLTAVGDYCYPT